jgi:hypothetical protein
MSAEPTPEGLTKDRRRIEGEVSHNFLTTWALSSPKRHSSAPVFHAGIEELPDWRVGIIFSELPSRQYN